MFQLENTQPLLNQQKRLKFCFLGYQLQFIKAYQFVRLNDQEGPNHDFLIKFLVNLR